MCHKNFPFPISNSILRENSAHTLILSMGNGVHSHGILKLELAHLATT